MQSRELRREEDTTYPVHAPSLLVKHHNSNPRRGEVALNEVVLL